MLGAGSVEIIAGWDGVCVSDVRALFREYAEAIGVDLCFQGFEQELAELPGRYAPNQGGQLWLARRVVEMAGCVAMHRIDERVCEMKRMYVRPAFRGMGLGRRLADAVITGARRAGYTRMRLDTLSSMKVALAMYETLGFRDMPPYRHNPMEGARFMELVL